MDLARKLVHLPYIFKLLSFNSLYCSFPYKTMVKNTQGQLFLRKYVYIIISSGIPKLISIEVIRQDVFSHATCARVKVIRVSSHLKSEQLQDQSAISENLHK